MFVKLGLQLISDMSIRIYSEASIAENPLLAAVLLLIKSFEADRVIAVLIQNYSDSTCSVNPLLVHALEGKSCHSNHLILSFKY